MSKSSPAISLNDLTALAAEKEKVLLSKFPAVRQVVYPEEHADAAAHSHHLNHVHQSKSATEPETKQLVELSQIAQQELDATFERLTTTLSDPSLLGQLEMRLYIEQQLGDLLQLVVSSQVATDQLPLQVGSMFGSKHSKRDSQDTLAQHGTVLEAELATTRLTVPEQAFSSGIEVAERFGIFYPVWLLQQFSVQPVETLQRWVGKQLLVINPIAKRVVVATILGIHPPSYRYSFSGTPELIRASGIWQPGSAGQVVLFSLESEAANGLYYV